MNGPKKRTFTTKNHINTQKLEKKNCKKIPKMAKNYTFSSNQPRPFEDHRWRTNPNKAKSLDRPATARSGGSRTFSMAAQLKIQTWPFSDSPRDPDAKLPNFFGKRGLKVGKIEEKEATLRRK